MTVVWMQRRACVVVTAMLVMLAMAPATVQAASMEIWPSERRANNTLFCYGNDWNWMLVAIYPEDHGKHRLELPEDFTEPTVLTRSEERRVGK